MLKKKTIAVIAATFLANFSWAGWSTDSVDKSTERSEISSEKSSDGLFAASDVAITVSDWSWNISKGSSEMLAKCIDQFIPCVNNTWTASVDSVHGSSIFISGAVSATLKFSGEGSIKILKTLAKASVVVIKASADVVFTTFSSSDNIIKYTIKGEFKNSFNEIRFYPSHVIKAIIYSDFHYKNIPKAKHDIKEDSP